MSMGIAARMAFASKAISVRRRIVRQLIIILLEVMPTLIPAKRAREPTTIRLRLEITEADNLFLLVQKVGSITSTNMGRRSMFRNSSTFLTILFICSTASSEELAQLFKNSYETDKKCLYSEFSKVKSENSNIPKVQWSGKCKDGFIEGLGTIIIERPNGARQEIRTTYINGLENGEGELIEWRANGQQAKFKGIWLNGVKVSGRLEVKNSDGSNYQYEGGFKEGKYAGQGKHTSSTGYELMGNFVDGKIQGNGVIKYADGGAYFGEMKNSLPDGIGKLTYKNGDVFDGNLREGKLNGYGKLVRVNSSLIEGYWLSGNLQDGAKTTFSGGNWYTGSYSGLLPHGEGIYSFVDGNIYIGSFVNGMFDGKGTLQYANGDTYEGDFAKNKRTGRGAYTWKSGKTTSGYFIDGVVDGIATEKFPNGDVINGLYKEGKKEGWWTIKSANGTTAYANFEGGQRVDVDSRSSTEPPNQSSANKAVATMNCNVYAKNMMAGEKPNIMAGPSVGASLLSGILEGARMDLDRKSYFNNCMSNYGF
jgi:hypothetical protein